MLLRYICYDLLLGSKAVTLRNIGWKGDSYNSIEMVIPKEVDKESLDDGNQTLQRIYL